MSTKTFRNRRSERERERGRDGRATPRQTRVVPRAKQDESLSRGKELGQERGNERKGEFSR